MEHVLAGYRRRGGIVGDVTMSGFNPRTIDKVERLLDLLEEMNAHPDLRGKLAMHQDPRSSTP